MTSICPDSALAQLPLDPVASGLAQVRSEMADQRADLLKWMFLFWVSTIVPLAGLMIALTKL